ncbi:MAG: tRNA preQ1(34) S-adenosylmethionine ribosyltransferase-isomerase QueA [Burkholderiales bacterium]
MKTSDFDFDLPADLIAQFPAPVRAESRLLRLDGRSGALCDARFSDFPRFLEAGDVLVLNDTRVIKARLHGRKQSGGAIEVLIERILSEHRALAFMRAARALKPGSVFSVAEGVEVQVLGRSDDLFDLKFGGELPLEHLLERYGSVPLPPYITHVPDTGDEQRYQTVYARHPGAVAAPTAGLHFDADVLDTLRNRGVVIAWVTLHVGAGTFAPLRTQQLSGHRMHAERFQVPEETVRAIETAQRAGHRITAVGTTSLRALESAALQGSLSPAGGDTDLFVVPGFRFRVVDRLLTNFHLPKTTLLVLVSAFGGLENIKHAYRHAVEQRYRFFSYGDAMLIERQT